MKKIVFLLPYFGKWPDWMPLYIDSVRRNTSIDFLFITDCDTSVLDNVPNVTYQKISFEAYVNRYKKILGEDIQIQNTYKICDLRPFYALVHEKDIADYDFFGWTDLDVLFGDIRAYYTDEILNKYNVLSSHQMRLAGHCALLRNRPKYRRIGFKIYNWKAALQNPAFVGIDEHGITNALTMTIFDKAAEKFGFSLDNYLLNLIRKLKTESYYFKEQYSTPFSSIPWIDDSLHSKQPDEWFYERGKITNARDGDRSFMYLHLMNFKSSTWRFDGTIAPWESGFVYDIKDINARIKIDKEGIKSL